MRLKKIFPALLLLIITTLPAMGGVMSDPGAPAPIPTPTPESGSTQSAQSTGSTEAADTSDGSTSLGELFASAFQLIFG